jgi:hypothetical protein
MKRLDDLVLHKIVEPNGNGTPSIQAIKRLVKFGASTIYGL